MKVVRREPAKTCRQGIYRADDCLKFRPLNRYAHSVGLHQSQIQWLKGVPDTLVLGGRSCLKEAAAGELANTFDFDPLVGGSRNLPWSGANDHQPNSFNHWLRGTSKGLPGLNRRNVSSGTGG